MFIHKSSIKINFIATFINKRGEKLKTSNKFIFFTNNINAIYNCLELKK
jgi:hypothetical protein